MRIRSPVYPGSGENCEVSSPFTLWKSVVTAGLRSNANRLERIQGHKGVAFPKLSEGKTGGDGNQRRVGLTGRIFLGQRQDTLVSRSPVTMKGSEAVVRAEDDGRHWKPLSIGDADSKDRSGLLGTTGAYEIREHRLDDLQLGW